MKIAVTGAFSYSGKYITRRLLARGEEVITLTGHPHRPDPFNGQVKTFPLDFDEAGMTKSLQGVDVLVNTDLGQDQVRHCYLRGAQVLRPDLVK